MSRKTVLMVVGILPRGVMRAILVFSFCSSAFAKIYLPDSASTIFGRIAQAHPRLGFIAIVAELGLGCWIFIGIKTDWAARIATAMLLGFIIIILRELWSDHPAPCGCFSLLSNPNTIVDIRADLTWSLMRNVVLFFAAIWLSTPYAGQVASVPK